MTLTLLTWIGTTGGPLIINFRNQGATYESEVGQPLHGPCGSFDAGWCASDSRRRYTNIDLHDPAAFFSSETKQPKIVDPQVFVQDPASPAATGPQNIQHVAGVRPALIEEDAKGMPLFNAKGESLGFDLGQWLSANGKVTITPSANGKAKISAQFSKLRPGASYSLFENHFDQQPVGFTPLDSAGKDNNFHSDKEGMARVTLTAPHMLTHANAVLLVYHSDKTFHGDQRGEIGVTAHHQLIVRIPE